MNRRTPSEAQDEERFRSLYLRTYPDVLRFVQRRVHSLGAEDVVAEVFLTAWRRSEDLPQGLDGARAWLYGIARNALLNERRSQGRRDALAVRIAEVPDLSTDTFDDIAVLRADVARAWHDLTAVEQETLSLSAFDGLTSPQAALVLGIKPVSYRLRLLRARRSLRRAIEPTPTTSPTAEVYR